MVDEQVLRETVSDCMTDVAYAIDVFQTEQSVFDTTSTSWETMDVARDKMKARILDLMHALDKYAREV